MDPQEKYSHMVVGFMFNHEDISEVLLIKKNRPSWCAGKWNGPGGKLEPGELPIEAMVREFKEETGLETRNTDWTYFHCMSGFTPEGVPFIVDYFAAKGEIFGARTVTDEQVSGRDVANLWLECCGGWTVDNLAWLVPLAVDHIHDGRPAHSTSTYPKQ